MATPLGSGIARTATQCRVDVLRAGDVIRYDNGEWMVHDVLPVAVTGGIAVVAYQPDAQLRSVLLFANPGATATLLVGEP